MPLGVSVVVEIPHDDPLPIGVNHHAFEEVSRMMAEYTALVWRSAVSGTVLPGMTQPVNDQRYARSIRVVRRDDSSYEVRSDYDKAKKIEDGYASFDMKPGLLSGPKARVTKDGLGMYTTIPFRAFTVANISDPKRSVAPPDILNYVRQHGRYDVWSGMSFGQRTKVPWLRYKGDVVGGVNYQHHQRRPETPAPMVEPYTWNRGKFAGLTKTRTAGGATRYFSFRRVSTLRTVTLPDGRVVWRGSDPSSWIHPGVAPNPISKAVQEFVAPRIEHAMEALTKGT